MTPFKITPFRHYLIAYEYISSKPGIKVLDFGCGNGEFISKIKSKTRQVFGFDVDPEKITVAKRNCPKTTIRLGKVGGPLPYKAGMFDVVTMFHVLEHVGSEKQAVLEACRVLKKGGLLLLASPYAGLFAWADAANLRYRFPRFHKWFIKLFLGNDEYTKRFVNNQAIGMYGDCTNSRSWHKHYRESEIRNLLGKKFSIMEIYKFSVLYPLLLIPYNIVNYLFKTKTNFLTAIIHVDNLIDAGEWSYNFLVVAKKQ